MCNKTNLMHYLSSVYFVNQSLHVSVILLAYHQEVYCAYATICSCCAFQLTVCWSSWDGTDVSQLTVCWSGWDGTDVSQLTVCWSGWDGTDVSRCTINET